MTQKHDSDPQCPDDLKQEVVATAPEPSDELTNVGSDAGSREIPSVVKADVLPSMPEIDEGGKNVGLSSKESSLGPDDRSREAANISEPVDTIVASSIEEEGDEKRSVETAATIEASQAIEAEENQVCIDELLATGIAADAGAVASECKAMSLALRESRCWVEKQRELNRVLERMVAGFTGVLRKFELQDQALSPEIRDELSSRAEGIRLCGRMLTRAHTRSSKAADESGSFDDIEIPVALRLETLSAKVDEKPRDEVEKTIETYLKKRRIDNNRRISDIRQRANSAEKTLLSVIERQVLPVIDGLDEGKKIGIATIESLIERFPEVKDKLLGWFRIYDVLISGMERELTRVGVQAFAANPGDAIDYDRYEPIDVEEDTNFGDEQIKETLRRGYLIRGIEDGQEYVIRPGQVVIVKNPTENSGVRLEDGC